MSVPAEHYASSSAFAREVRAGLAASPQKYLPSKYLYDEVGSALFEAITVLPEYGVTRAEERLLRRHARDIAAGLAQPLRVAELGSGSGKKTRYLLEALGAIRPTVYCPIEISPSALQLCQRELADLKQVSIVGYQSDYLAGLAEASTARRQTEALCVLFLGSTIGNFETAAAVGFLRSLRALLRPGDQLLLGCDLIKPIPDLLLAYDDPAGVTAAFNKNLLARINRELDANFDLKHFDHVARFNPQASSVEMHLRARTAHRVEIRAADVSVSFAEGETIWTESSHKYRIEQVLQMGRDAGFAATRQWQDAQGSFAEVLFTAL